MSNERITIVSFSFDNCQTNIPLDANIQQSDTESQEERADLF